MNFKSDRVSLLIFSFSQSLEALLLKAFGAYTLRFSYVVHMHVGILPIAPVTTVSFSTLEPWQTSWIISFCVWTGLIVFLSIRGLVFIEGIVLTVIEAFINCSKIVGRPVARGVECPLGSTRCQLVSATSGVPQDLTRETIHSLCESATHAHTRSHQSTRADVHTQTRALVLL